MRFNSQIKLLFWIILFESIGFFLGQLTQANLEPWYNSLNKSSLTPPGLVFSIVWSLLYGLLAVIAWILSNLNKSIDKKMSSLFSLQMLMNWSWTILFFERHWITFSAIWLVFLTGLNILLFIIALKKHKKIAWLLIPYLLWLAYATYLNGIIAFIN